MLLQVHPIHRNALNLYICSVCERTSKTGLSITPADNKDRQTLKRLIFFCDKCLAQVQLKRMLLNFKQSEAIKNKIFDKLDIQIKSNFK